MSCSKATQEMKMENRAVWSTQETQYFINLIKDNNIVSLLDGRKNRNADIYKLLVPLMKDAGFPRSLEQMRIKWKHLQVAYRKAKDKNNVSGHSRHTCPFFEELEEILQTRPNANYLENGIDSGDVNVKSGEDDEYIVTESGELVLVGNAVATSLQEEFESNSSASSSRSTPSPRMYNKKRNSKTDTFVTLTENMLKNHSTGREDFWKSEFDKQREWETKQQQLLLDSNAKLMTDTMSQFVKCMQGPPHGPMGYVPPPPGPMGLPFYNHYPPTHFGQHNNAHQMMPNDANQSGPELN